MSDEKPDERPVSAEASAAARALGALGASKGGLARAAKLSAAKRSAIAAKGGKAARGVPRAPKRVRCACGNLVDSAPCGVCAASGNKPA